jgi:signal transduction histidine kinase
MLRSEISSILNLLSIVSNSEYVFAFSEDDSSIFMPEQLIDTDFGKNIATIELSNIQSQFASNDHSTEHADLLQALSNDTLGEQYCLYVSNTSLLEIQDEAPEQESENQLPNVSIGIFAAPNTSWTKQQLAGIKSILNLLKKRAKEDYKIEREVIIKDLKRSNKDLDNFAYVASHDLKAPLNVIKRLVSWVMEDCADILPQDSVENLELVMSRANRMEQLLQDLLAYSRIGKDYQEASEINVKSKVVELLSLIDLPMGFTVKCDDIEVKVPEVPFGVVLLNLIANAIKHHDSGNASIEIKVRRNQTANVITVMDDGPGISPDNRAKIFDLFETLQPRDEIEGSGMGLSVVKRLVEHYGGYIKVDENRPRGTKFIVYWPFANMARQVLTKLSD